GCAGSKTNGRSTGPSTGHVHARADAGSASTHSTTTAKRRTANLLVVRSENEVDATGAMLRCQYWLQGTAVQPLSRPAPPDPRQPPDTPRRPAARESLPNKRHTGGARSGNTPRRFRPRADHERDLSTRRLAEPQGDLRSSSAHDLLVHLRELAADSDLAIGLD